jgi:hypothetical protein
VSAERGFDLVLHRVYDEEDLGKCEFLELRAQRGAFHGFERLQSGELFIHETLLPSQPGLSTWDFVSGYSQDTWLVVPARVKDLLSQELFAHLTWKPARFWPGDVDPMVTWEIVKQKIGTPFWELDSDLSLPPVSSTMDLCDRDDNHVQAGERRINIIRRDGLYAYPELRYRKSELAKLPSFDVARSYENFGLVPPQEFRPDYSSIVVSKKFYRFCHQNNLNADWLPVHIDPGA